MSQVAEINANIDHINQTLAQIQKQLVDKQALVEDLKKANAKLVELSLGKLRKSPSLRLQREKIFDLNCQIQELQFVQGSLKEKLEKAKQNLHEASIRHRLEEYAKAEAYQLNLIQEAQNLLAKYANAIAEIEGLQGHRNALEQLVRINADLNDGKGLSDYGIDLGEVLTKFNQAKLSCNFDFSRIENLNIGLQNLINQLVAIHKGKRGFHQAQTRKAPTRQIKPHVDPLRQAQFYERSRLQSQDDLSMALRGRKKIIPHNHNR